MDEFRCPPVVFAQQVHDGWHQQHAHDGRINEQREDHAEGDVFHHHDVRETKGSGHHDHDERGGSDDATGMRGTRINCFICGCALLAGFDHARDKKDLIVCGQAVDDGDDENQDWAHQRAGGETQQASAHAGDKHCGQNAQCCA